MLEEPILYRQKDEPRGGISYIPYPEATKDGKLLPIKSKDNAVSTS